MNVKKAVIPAAGLGTRVLPASKAVPKEMLPIVDKPAIQYIVEEAVASGIEDILIITNRGKSIIEDHFDHSPELEHALKKPGKESLYDSVIESAQLGNILFKRQGQTLGLGHAVYGAKSFIGDEPFVVLYGDDVIMGSNPVAKQLIDAYEEFGLSSLGIKEVPAEQLSRYSSLELTPIRDNFYKVTDMIEKPAKGAEFSRFSILGRVLLTPEIFGILEKIPRGAGNEYQLTDAIKVMARDRTCIGVDFDGQRYDMGNKVGMLKAIVDTALQHPETREEFREYLKTLNIFD